MPSIPKPRSPSTLPGVSGSRIPLCLKYGGGGHHNAGTCQLENDEVDEKLPDIIAALNK